MQHTMRGKWSEPGVPHKGWQCTDTEDVGAPDHTCEMCESMPVRFIHHMTHPDYAEALGVGCICAANMSDDYVGARQREKRLKQQTARRRRPQQRKPSMTESCYRPPLPAPLYVIAALRQLLPGWTVSASGVASTSINGLEITVFHNEQHRLWAGNIQPCDSNYARAWCQFQTLELVVQTVLDFVQRKDGNA